jgi:PAS domain S-box-containing protein
LSARFSPNPAPPSDYYLKGQENKMRKELSNIKFTVKYSPLWTAALYLIISALYIAFSDMILSKIVTDANLYVRIQTLKGIAFVMISAALLYYFIRSPLNKVYQGSLRLAQSEEKVRLIFESMTDGVVVIDNQNRVIETNSALLKTCGVHSRAELIHRDIYSFFETQDHDRLRRDLENTQKSGNSGVREYNIYKTGGGQFPARINAAILKDGDGQPAGIVAIIEDISENRRSQAQLEELYQKALAQSQELQEESKARGMFIEVLAHELRTPLTPIVVCGDILSDTLASSDSVTRRKLTANIVEGASTLSKRLEELLEIGRFSRGSFVLAQQRVDTAVFFQKVISRLSPILEKNRQTLKSDLAADLPTIKIDPDRLELVMQVLVNNAAGFSPPQSEIRLSVGVGHGSLWVEVEDQGPGISEAEIAHLFKPYHRTEQDRQKYPGIGLGMAVARQIIEAHGGRIEVTSVPGKGSLFRFEIPLN